MLEKVKLHSNGYTKTYEGGVNHSINADISLDDEVTEFVANGGTVEPEFTQAELDQQVKDTLIGEIDTRLNEIDMLSIRSLRSKSNGRGNAQDDTTLTALDDEAETLRTERGTL